MDGNNAPAFTAAGDVVVASFGQHTVHVLAATTGAGVHTCGAQGSAPLQFEYPCGVCVSHADTIIVADCVNDRLQEVAHLGRGPATLLAAGLVQGPRAVALTPTEDALVVRQQGGANRVLVLTRDGSAIVRVLLTTADVAYGYFGLAVSRSGVVAVPVFSKQQVVVVSVDGAWKRSIDAAVLGSPLGNVYGAAFDSREQIWTCDFNAKCFVVIAPK